MEQNVHRGYDMGLAALIGPGIYNMGELVRLSLSVLCLSVYVCLSIYRAHSLARSCALTSCLSVSSGAALSWNLRAPAWH